MDSNFLQGIDTERDDIIYYVDSDGVIADFASWARSKDAELIDESGNAKEGCVDKLHKIMVDNYRECYLNLDVLSTGEFFIQKLKTCDNWYVLTASLALKKIRKFVSDLSLSQEIFDTLCENKYKWYEKLGIPRNKVIITGSRSEKQHYAKGCNVLFDDFIENIEDWKKKGGIACQIGNRSR